jgi:hypothetical protein
VCEVCGATAASKKNLKRHMKLRHPESKKKSKRGKYAKRPYHKPTVTTSSIDRGIAKARKLGLLTDPVPPQPVPVTSEMKSSDKLREMADSFQRKAELLRGMAMELDRI